MICFVNFVSSIHACALVDMVSERQGSRSWLFPISFPNPFLLLKAIVGTQLVPWNRIIHLNSIKMEAKNTVTNADSSGDPYYLFGSDHPGMQLTNKPFNGMNYPNWSKSTRMALEAKSKLGFVDGSLDKLAEGTNRMVEVDSMRLHCKMLDLKLNCLWNLRKLFVRSIGQRTLGGIGRMIRGA